MRRDDAHLLDILKAARLAIEFKGAADKSEFLTDVKTESAVLHQLLIIGEAVKRMSPEFRSAHPQVPRETHRWGPDKLILLARGIGQISLRQIALAR